MKIAYFAVSAFMILFATAALFYVLSKIDIYISDWKCETENATVYRGFKDGLIVVPSSGSRPLIANFSNKRVIAPSNYSRRAFGVLVWPKNSYAGYDLKDRLKGDRKSDYDFRHSYLKIKINNEIIIMSNCI